MNYKVFISVDMEGITGVIHWDEVLGDHKDYHYFRKIMTQEANAAIEGALQGGATEILVRDSHANARNILPDLLHEEAKLLREWSTGPYGMMEGIDDSFDAVIFVGYHAKASSPNATLKHTMTGAILDLKVNGVSMPELGWNGLIAGYHNVPVVFISGDKAVCEQAKHFFPEIETAVVKEARGQAAIHLHPNKAQKLIKTGVTRALKHITKFEPLQYKKPYAIEIIFKSEDKAYRAAWYPDAERIGDLGIKLTCEDFMDCLRFFLFAR